MGYGLTLPRFQGPLEKLLELVEARELPISEVSLSQVTADFLTYIQSLDHVPSPLLADFIVVASRLLLIKSKSLLPEFTLTDEEEGEIHDLEARLLLYREFRPAVKLFLARWLAPEYEASRPYFLSRFGILREEGVFYPGENLTLPALAGAVAAIAEEVSKFERETATVREAMVSVEEKIQEIVARLANEFHTSFHTLSREKSKSEVIAIFLALLHLAREERVELEQGERFSDILVKKLT